ncbi:hypothetical protein BC829DRAFT_422144 [Chytridium lagenaria]|nr:hypothetical protein BC829DRAFT_422144 [Chytridium lagenaria]
MLKSFALIVALAQVALSAPLPLSLASLNTLSLTQSAEVSVRLAAAPTSAATIYLDAPGLKLTDCSFKFTPSDWQTPKKVRLIGGGDAKTTSYTLNAQVFAPGSTFDGRYYDFQGQGVFYLLRTPTLSFRQTSGL